MLLRSLVIVRLCVERTCSIASLVWLCRLISPDRLKLNRLCAAMLSMGAMTWFAGGTFVADGIEPYINCASRQFGLWWIFTMLMWTEQEFIQIELHSLSSLLRYLRFLPPHQINVKWDWISDFECVCSCRVCYQFIIVTEKRKKKKKRKSASGGRSDRSALMWQHIYLIQYSAGERKGEIAGCWSRTIHYKHHRCRQTTVFVCECAWPSYRFSIGTPITMRI